MFILHWIGKIRRFLSMSLSAYHVPLEEQEKIMSFVSGLDIIKIAERVVQELIQALAMRFEFKLGSAGKESRWSSCVAVQKRPRLKKRGFWRLPLRRFLQRPKQKDGSVFWGKR